MVNFRKILHATSRFNERKAGYYKYPLYRVVKFQTTPANHITGTPAVYTETLAEISGDFSPFVAKRWGAVTEDFADMSLMTDIELTFDLDNEDLNDEIEYHGVRYRIVDARHLDRIAFDDCFSFALKRKTFKKGF